MPFAEAADGVRVAYVDFGGTGRLLLMAHATGFHSRVWQPVARRLANNFHCIAFDERGHGDTPPPSGALEWRGFGLDALAVIDAVSPGEQWFGVGHSAGGAALLLAELERPGTFEAIYAYEPIVPPPEGFGPGGAVPPGHNPMSEAARRRREVFASRDAAYENYAAKPPLEVFDPEALRAYVDYGFGDLPDGTVRLKCRGEQEARTYEMAGSHRTFDRLGDVSSLVTVAFGEHTDTFGPAMFRMVAERLGRGRAEELQGLGHFGPMQDPAALAGSILAAF
jgi:pimeloyl-ACP methyl ester carboxylesterase